MTHRRAALIARDQSSKASAVIENTRRKELGITQAIWQHSGGGHVPRPLHVKAGRDKLVFDLDKGAYIDGKWILPGTEINCLPGDSVIEFATGCKKLWRRRYSGDLTEIVTASGKTIKATPNHPVLTGRGWIAIQSVDVGDYVIRIADQVIDSVETDVQGGVPKFSELFDAVSRYVNPVSAGGTEFKFHGDHANGEVETIDVDGFLPSELDASFCKKFAELFFPWADKCIVAIGFHPDSTLYSACNRLFCAPEGVIRGFSSLLPLLQSHGAHADDICLRLSPYLNAALNKAASDASPCCAIAAGKLKLANSGLVVGDNQVIGELFNAISRASLGWQGDTASADELGNRYGMQSDQLGSTFDACSRGFEDGDCVIDKRRIDYNGHVYNLENGLNWYSSNTYIIHNCRCTSRAIIPGFED